MEPNWKPLEKCLGQHRCAGFMFMGRLNGVNMYEHGIARLELNLDDNGHCFVRQDDTFKSASFEEELAKLEVVLTQMGETFESAYDDAYIERKIETLRRAGIDLIRIQIEPENISVD